MKSYSIVLSLLAILFLGRVVGQGLVVVFSPSFFPPMEAWYSGIVTYRFLLPAQVAILVLQLEITRQLWKGKGVLTRLHFPLGRGLKWFALCYFLAMVARYIVGVTVFPERGGFSEAIPIFFHWVLAAYLYLLSRYYRGLPLAGFQFGRT